MQKKREEEYQYLEDITRQGMSGRKQQTKRMRCVLTLVFFLITLTVFVLQTIEKTKETEQLHMYGSWKIAEYGQDSEQSSTIVSDLNMKIQKEGKESVVGAVCDKNQNIVSGIGTMDETLKEVGNIQLLDGAWPEKDEEVAMEADVLEKLNYSYELGQKITLSVIEQKESTGIPLEDIEVQKKKKGFVCIDRNSEKVVNSYQVKTRTFVLSGVIDNYSANWDNGGYWLLNGIVLGKDSKLFSHEVEVHHFYTTKTSIQGLGNVLLEKQEQSDTDKQPSLVCNTEAYAQDKAQSITNVMFFTVIFAISIYIVFQQFMMQIQKRKYYLTVLQDIGADRQQLLYMIRLERKKLLVGSVPLGVFLGLVFSLTVIKIFSVFYKGTIVIGCNVLWLLLSIFAEYVMVNVCFLLPLYLEFYKIDCKNKKETAQKAIKRRKRKSNPKQSLLSISFRHASFHKAEFFTGVGISILICIAMCFMLLIAYTQTFQKKGYEESGQGQYVFYKEKGKKTKNIALKEVDAIDGVKYSVAENEKYGQISFANMKKSPILQDKRKKNKEEDVTYEDSKSKFQAQYNAVKYTINTCEKETYYKKLAEQAEKPVDMERFLKGETVLIYIPDYISCSAQLESILAGMDVQEEEKGKKILEYVRKPSQYYRNVVKRDLSLQVGDTVSLKTFDGKEEKLVIGGIVRNFDPSVCWFSQPFEMIAVCQNQKVKDGAYDSCNVFTDKDATYNKTDKKMASLLQGHEWYNLRLDWERSKHTGDNRMRVILFVGICIILFTFYIQFTNNQSQLWKEQNRIGILRTLGISSRKFYLLYVLQALGQAVIGLVVGMLSFALASFWISANYMDSSGAALGNGGSAFQMLSAGVLNLRGFFAVALEGYPVACHVIAVILYVIFTVLVYVLPLRKQLKKSITENIRQLEKE